MGLKGLLGQILLDAGIIGQETLDAALGRTARTTERLGEALVAMRAASKDGVLRSVAVQVGLPVFAYRPAGRDTATPSRRASIWTPSRRC